MNLDLPVDIAIIGAGCVGSAIAQRLAKYSVSIALIEKEDDVAMGSTKANSGIIHAGYFMEDGSMKEKMNLLGYMMFDEVCPQIGVDFIRPGATFCATNEEELETLRCESEVADRRNVPHEFIDDNDRIHELEPALGDNILAVLFYPTAGVIVPFELTIGLAEHAIMNGTSLLLGFEVINITRNDDLFTIESQDGISIQAKTVINAAGVNSDKIANMVGLDDFYIIPRRGEYILFDKNAIPVKTIIFPTPTMASKGILVSPTLHGNIFIGPNSHQIDVKEYNATTTDGLNEIIAGAKKLVPNIPLRLAITNFAGVRATPSTHDFIVGTTSVPQFVNAAGIESPGLSSCLAIAKTIEEVLQNECGYSFEQKLDYIPTRPKQQRLSELSESELADKIKENPQWGQMVCRCEQVTEAEIVEACHSPIPITNTDMIKRRLRPGMGRCQGGFCLPKVMKILSREQQIIYGKITKLGKNSQIVMGRTKELTEEIYSRKQL